MSPGSLSFQSLYEVPLRFSLPDPRPRSHSYQSPPVTSGPHPQPGFHTRPSPPKNGEVPEAPYRSSHQRLKEGLAEPQSEQESSVVVPSNKDSDTFEFSLSTPSHPREYGPYVPVTDRSTVLHGPCPFPSSSLTLICPTGSDGTQRIRTGLSLVERCTIGRATVTGLEGVSQDSSNMGIP